MSSAVTSVTIDTTRQYQTLAGLGATLAYAEPSVLAYPDPSALYDTMFGKLGLDMLRLRNRYGYAGDDDLASAAAIVDGARSSLGRQPTVVLASWSPPATLKGNAATTCQGNADTCTLKRLAGGGFDYATYGRYWRNSLDAYSAVGLAPDYISIQNNPDYVPSSLVSGEACKFLPREGTSAVIVNGTESILSFPGYDEALGAVLSALEGLAPSPNVIAPDTSTPGAAVDYLAALDPSRVSAIGHHLYGSSAASPDFSGMQTLRSLGSSVQKPLFQTETPSEGIDTAVLLHHAFVTEGAAAYLHNGLVGPAATATVDPGALVVLDDDGFRTQTQYEALRHFALHTDPGWLRVQATCSDDRVLGSAWLSPDGRGLTVVLVNASSDSLQLQLEAPWASARIYRTSFEGTERHADLGAVPSDGVVRMPARSLVTIANEH